MGCVLFVLLLQRARVPADGTRTKGRSGNTWAPSWDPSIHTPLPTAPAWAHPRVTGSHSPGTLSVFNAAGRGSRGTPYSQHLGAPSRLLPTAPHPRILTLHSPVPPLPPTSRGSAAARRARVRRAGVLPACPADKVRLLESGLAQTPRLDEPLRGLGRWAMGVCGVTPPSGSQNPPLAAAMTAALRPTAAEPQPQPSPRPRPRLQAQRRDGAAGPHPVPPLSPP